MKYKMMNLSLTPAGNSVTVAGNLCRSSDGVSWQQAVAVNTSIPTAADQAAFESTLVASVIAIAQQDAAAVNNYLGNLVTKYEGKVFTV